MQEDKKTVPRLSRDEEGMKAKNLHSEQALGSTVAQEGAG